MDHFQRLSLTHCRLNNNTIISNKRVIAKDTVGSLNRQPIDRRSCCRDGDTISQFLNGKPAPGRRAPLYWKQSNYNSKQETGDLRDERYNYLTKECSGWGGGGDLVCAFVSISIFPYQTSRRVFFLYDVHYSVHRPCFNRHILFAMRACVSILLQIF